MRRVNAPSRRVDSGHPRAQLSTPQMSACNTSWELVVLCLRVDPSPAVIDPSLKGVLGGADGSLEPCVGPVHREPEPDEADHQGREEGGTCVSECGMR